MKITILAFLLVFVIGSLYGQARPTTPDERPAYIIAERTLEDVNVEKRWNIKILYPMIVPETNAPAKDFNERVKKLAHEQLADFRSGFDDISEEEYSSMPKDMKFTLEVGYEITHMGPELVSIRFGRYEYTGGAHPNSWTFTVNYDLSKGRPLVLADLFRGGTRYREIISELSVKELNEKLGNFADPEWIRTGAGPETGNFENWNLTDRGLAVTFDPYTVGPYAAGGFEVTVPFEMFPDSVRAEDFYRYERVSYIDGNPPNLCRNGHFPGYDTDFGLAVVNGRKNERAYFYDDDRDCPNGKDCRRKAYIIPGDEVIVAREYGDYSCVWYEPAKGSETVGWIRTDRLEKRKLKEPQRADWLGEWEDGVSSITIRPGTGGNGFHVKGDSYWQGAVEGSIHIGELDYPGRLVGAVLESSSGDDEYDCRVRMRRIGGFLLVSDNKNCGGVNVSFDGVYRRTRATTKK